MKPCWFLDGYWFDPEAATVPGLVEWVELGLRAACALTVRESTE